MITRTVPIAQSDYSDTTYAWGPQVIPANLTSVLVYFDTPAGNYPWVWACQKVVLQLHLMVNGLWQEFGVTFIGSENPPVKPSPHRYTFECGLPPTATQYWIGVSVIGGPITLSGQITFSIG